MPWYPCFTEEELHNGWGAVVVHDALLPAEGQGRARQATFDGVFPAEVRAKVLAAEGEAEGGAGAGAEAPGRAGAGAEAPGRAGAGAEAPGKAGAGAEAPGKAGARAGAVPGA
ncbi:hypothetical protein ACWDGI_29150 [Streptomyces sp. NPDC001220]